MSTASAARPATALLAALATLLFTACGAGDAPVEPAAPTDAAAEEPTAPDEDPHLTNRRGAVIDTSIEPDLDRFNDPQTPGDLFPPSVEEFTWTFRLVDDTVRYIGGDGQSALWVGRDELGQICLVVMFPDKYGAGTCQPPQHFNGSGLSVSSSGGDAPNGSWAVWPDALAGETNLERARPARTDGSATEESSTGD